MNGPAADDVKAFQSTSVRADIQTDGGPGKWRIGLIVLSNDYTVERDFMNLRAHGDTGNDIAIFATRIPFAADCTVASLQAMAPSITEATKLLVPDGRLDAVAYTCTSGFVVIGYDAICERIQSLRPNTPCITPITASLAALDTFGAQKLAVLTPYIDDVNGLIAAHLNPAGKEIVGFCSFQIEDNEEMAAVTPEAIYQAALKADRPDADALFISCTAIRAVDVVERIEQKLGKPVVTANQALIWQSLRSAGYDAKIPGYGALLRLTRTDH
jgi:maleate isomerase